MKHSPKRFVEPRVPPIKAIALPGWIVWLILTTSAGFVHAQTDSLSRLREIRERHQAALKKFEQDSQGDRAKQHVRSYRAVFPDDRQTIFPIDRSQPGFLDETLAKANQKYASQLFEFAKTCDLDKHSALAFQLLHEVLVYDPEHAEARRILGFKKLSSGKWYRPTRKITARKATTKQSIVGWKARTYITVDSGHYRISTTADEKTAIALAEKLERWQNVWRQVFFDYWVKPGTVQRWFDGKTSMRQSSRKHRVVFFKSRAEYLETMRELGVAGAEHSTGNYNDKIKTIFFYAGDDDPNVRITWLHEQAHQLFQETGITKKGATDKLNFWLVEAVAMYMESLTEPRGKQFVTVGGMESQRLQYARIRANRQGFYVPLAKLSEMGRVQFQRNQDVRSLYSQAAGLAHFFMTNEHGKFRQAFVRLLRLAYEKRSKANSLSQALGTGYDKLDVAYRRFLIPHPGSIKNLSDQANRTELALGASPITSEQLKVIGGCKNLLWLQLSGTKIDDAAGKTVALLKNLDQLFVDSTSITDAFVSDIAGLEKLYELDLARTRITDKSLDVVSRFTNLKVLYLTKTNITDVGLAKLSTLRQLEHLDVSGTKVTPAALANLKAKLPNLK